MDTFFMAHIEDLSEKSRTKNIYTFSGFLNEEEQNEIISNQKKLTDFSFFGGVNGAQRKMVRFGNENDLYYSEDFPIDYIRIDPINIKFSDELSHRDCLGAIMNLSIKRELIGDIIIKEKTVFVFADKKISSFICENMKKIKHTDVKCRVDDFDNSAKLYTLEEETVLTSSLRADCVISSFYKLSRNASNELFNAKKVFINSAVCESSSKILKENDTVSVRGFGKFIYKNTLSQTKKGRLKISLHVYR